MVAQFGDRALDGFTLMLFGGNYMAETSTVAKICSYETYVDRAQNRLTSATASELHETVRMALQKAVDRGRR